MQSYYPDQNEYAARVLGVTLENLQKIFAGEVHALGPLDLDVTPGELLVVVGPSGCGKTTLLRLISGLEPVSRGTIRIGDRDVTQLAPRHRNVAMVFQEYALYPHLSVRGNLEFALKMAKVAAAVRDEKVAEAATLLNLEELLDRQPHQLSGGQRQRVALGRAIVRDVDVFLLDEPLSSVDVTLRRQLREAIGQLHAALGVTTIYVTHDQQEAMALAGRMAVMNRGVIQQIAAPMDVYRHPANRFVAGFVGEVPMNFFDGQILSDAGHLWFRMKQSKLRIPQAMAEPLRAQDGCDAVLGVRPEAMRLASESGDATQVLRGKIESVDLLGECYDVRLHTGTSSPTVARLLPRDLAENTRLAAGDTVRLAIKPDGMFFFSPDPVGRNLLLTEG